jgi:zona occludens toxin
MTIYLYSGTPGSGKSLHATKDIKQRLDLACPVIANYRLSPSVKHFEMYTYKDNEELTPEFLYEYASDWWAGSGKYHKFREDFLLLVIDEAQLLFNSREWNHNKRMGWIEFFSQHRHFGYKIIFISQSDRMLDRQIRSLLEYDVVHRRLGNFGWRGKLFTILTFGELFVATTHYYSLHETVAMNAFKAHKSIFKMYDSYASFKRTADGVAAAGAPSKRD